MIFLNLMDFVRYYFPVLRLLRPLQISEFLAELHLDESVNYSVIVLLHPWFRIYCYIYCHFLIYWYYCDFALLTFIKISYLAVYPTLILFCIDPSLF